MHAISIDDQRLVWGPADAPPLRPGHVRIDNRATAVNRADLYQAAGRYDPPPGASPILGLECAGTISQIADDVTGWAVGDRVAALLSGGGYATQVVCPAQHLLPVPEQMDWQTAAALPEAVCTAWLNLVMLGGLTEGDHVLLHAGASGVGTIAIQICKRLGATCFVTAGSDDKIDRCKALGAQGGANRHCQRFVEHRKEWTGGRGFDVILDPVGGAYLEDNVRSLATEGRLVIIGLLGGRKAELDIGRLMVKRQQIIGSVLRARSDQQKADIVAAVQETPWAWACDGTLRPVLDATLPIQDAQAAHERIASNETVGKIVLVVDG